MKKLLLFAAIAATTFASCSKDDKKCADWMTGTDCKTEVRAQYAGYYKGTVTFDGDSYESDMTISATGALNELLSDGVVKFILSNQNSGDFTIPYGVEIDGGLYTRGGCYGSFNGKSINVWLTLDDGQGLNGSGEVYNLSFSGAKQ